MAGAAGTGSPPSSTERLYVAAGRISATGWGLLIASVAIVLWLAVKLAGEEEGLDGVDQVVIVVATAIPLVALSLLVVVGGITARLVVLARQGARDDEGEE